MTWAASPKLHLSARFWIVVLIGFLLWFCDAPGTFAAESGAGPLYVRVRLSTGLPVQLIPNTPSTLLVDDKPLKVKRGQALDISFADQTFTVRAGDAIWTARWLALTPDEAPLATQPARVHGVQVNNGTLYRARIEALSYGGTPYLVNVVPMNDYLYGVLGGEMPISWPIESLKAQAVAARTYALYHIIYRDRSDTTPWDVCDTQDCQVYSGTQRESPTAYEAVRLTDRKVLVYTGPDVKYKNQLINAVFHSTSPGRTYNVEEVWTSYRPYLRTRDDSAYSQSSPWFRWSKDISISVSSLASVLGMKQITTLAPVASSLETRSYIASGGGISRTFSKEQLRKWFNLRSPSFDLKAADGRLITNSINPGATIVAVNGKGFGHGVGLSQYGAKTMAERGWDYTKIMNFYYTDVELRPYRLSGMRWPSGYPGI